MLATDPGATLLGEIGIGTNFGIDRPVGTILFDEKIGGTVHLAVGRSYPETGGVNESAVHWDMICDLREGGRLTADGEAILEDGRVHLAARAREVLERRRRVVDRRQRRELRRRCVAPPCAARRPPARARPRAAALRLSPRSAVHRAAGAAGAPRATPAPARATASALATGRR